MAREAAFFILAFVLLASTQVISIEESIVAEQHHHKHAPAHAPVSTPKKAPTHAPIPWPKKAPAYPPKKAPAHPPAHHTAHSPAKSISHPGVPVSQPHHVDHGECGPMCINYCKNHKPKRECERDCVPCCTHYKCVPVAYKSCSSWSEVKHHGRTIKCPKF